MTVASFDCPVHALDLAIGPWMARFGQPMFDIKISAGKFEGMDADRNTLRPHFLDVIRGPSIAAGIGKIGAVIGQDGINLAGNRCDDCLFFNRQNRRTRLPRSGRKIDNGGAFTPLRKCLLIDAVSVNHSILALSTKARPFRLSKSSHDSFRRALVGISP